MKTYIPHSIKARLHKGVKPAIDIYIYSWQWRSNVLNSPEPSLWEALGNLLDSTE